MTTISNFFSSIRPNMETLSYFSRVIRSIDEVPRASSGGAPKDSEMLLLSLSKATLFIYGASQEAKVKRASFDCDCLRAQCLLALYACEIETECCNEPDMSSDGTLPFIMADSGKVYNGNAIKAFISERANQVDFFNRGGPMYKEIFMNEEIAITYIESKLQPCLIYAYWVDERIYMRLTREVYTRVWPHGLKRYLIWKERRKRVRHLQLLEAGGDIVPEKMYEAAARCLENLTALLDHARETFGHHEYYLLSKRALEVDAIVFSYLYNVLEAFPKDHELCLLVTRHSLLVDYLHRLAQLWSFS